MPHSLKRQTRLDAHAVERMQPFRALSCGRCGATFPSKSAKAKHKRQCNPAMPAQPAEICAAEDLYTDMRRHSSARIKALAAAEWEAMDWRGELPADWPERRAELEREWL